MRLGSMARWRGPAFLIAAVWALGLVPRLEPVAQAGQAGVGEAVDAARPEASGASAAAQTAEANHGQSPDFMSLLFVFVLATFIGLGVILRVSRLLHTPLMSLTNAISAIVVVGAIIVAGGEDYPPLIRVLGSVALFAAMTNIVSGFLITDRMLRMFRTRGVRK